MQSLRARCIERLHAALRRRVAEASGDPRYPELLTWLTTTAILCVPDEQRLRVRCREMDAAALAACIPAVFALLSAVLRQRGVATAPQWQLTIDATPLPPPPQLQVIEDNETAAEGARPLPTEQRRSTSLGGVVVVARDGLIRVQATLDRRTDDALRVFLPVLRRMLWGEDLGAVWRFAEQRRGRVRRRTAISPQCTATPHNSQ